MKNLSIALNIVLLIAVIALYVMHFSDKNATSSTSISSSKSYDGPLKVAYVNSDTLIKNYALFEQMSKTLEDKRAKFDKQFTDQEKALNTEINAFQKSAQRMSPGEIQAREENLMMKRQGLMQYQERLTQELMQDQAILNDSLYNQITSFLNQYSKAKNYDLILSYQKGGAILYGHDSLEITKDVIKGLNEQHHQGKK